MSSTIPNDETSLLPPKHDVEKQGVVAERNIRNQAAHCFETIDPCVEEIEDGHNVTTSLVFAVGAAVLAPFLFGYNLSVMNAPENVVFIGHSMGSWSLAVAIFAIGGPFGAMMAGSYADTHGRRRAVLLSAWAFLLGGIIQAWAPNMAILTISRFIIGFASGFAMVVVPIYLGEVSTPAMSGTIGTLTQFSLVIGVLVSDLLAFSFATEELWRILFSVTAIVSGAQILLAPVLLESPRWLLVQNPSSSSARKIIKKLRGYGYDSQVEIEVDRIIVSTIVPECHEDSPSSGSSVIEMFSDKKVRILVISAIFLHVAQQLSGANAVFYYSTIFFEGVISDPLIGTTVVFVVNVLATFVALLLMDSCGRRTLILWSSGGMFACCILIVLALLGVFNNVVALCAVNLYIVFYAIGLAPIPWLIVAEMFDAKYVSTAMTVATVLNWSSNFLVGLVFPYLLEYLGPFCFIPFAAVLLFTFVYAFIWLPETRGKTPAELEEGLAQQHFRC